MCALQFACFDSRKTARARDDGQNHTRRFIFFFPSEIHVFVVHLYIVFMKYVSLSDLHRRRAVRFHYYFSPFATIIFHGFAYCVCQSYVEVHRTCLLTLYMCVSYVILYRKRRYKVLYKYDGQLVRSFGKILQNIRRLYTFRYPVQQQSYCPREENVQIL